MAIGTITSDASISVRFLGGKNLGSVEESFLSKLRPGDRFLFAGRNLELVRIREMQAFVRAAKRGSKGVPRWMGGRLPLSNRMSAGMRERARTPARSGVLDTPEMQRLSGRTGHPGRAPHASPHGMNSPSSDSRAARAPPVIYPPRGRLAMRDSPRSWISGCARSEPNTFSLAFNDYGIEMLSPRPAAFDRGKRRRPLQ